MHIILFCSLSPLSDFFLLLKCSLKKNETQTFVQAHSCLLLLLFFQFRKETLQTSEKQYVYI